MSSQEPSAIFDRLRRRWQRRLWLTGFLEAAAWGLPTVAVFVALLGRAGSGGGSSDPRWSLVVVAALVVLVLIVGWAAHRRRSADGAAGLAKMARHLDARLPMVEHSSALLLRSSDRLGTVERLQRQRVGAALAGFDAQAEKALLPTRPLRGAVRAVGLGLLAALGLGVGLSSVSSQAGMGGRSLAPDGEEPTTVFAPALNGIEVRVAPPSYTGLKPTAHDALSVLVPAGSTVQWRLETEGKVDTAYLVLDDERIPLTRAQPEQAQPEQAQPEQVQPAFFHGQRTVGETMVYTVHLEDDGQTVARSPFARVRVVADQPPTVMVRSPALTSEVNRSVGLRVPLVVEVDDDYGVAEVAIVATLALGAGEQVAFREARFGFSQDQPMPIASRPAVPGGLDSGRTAATHRRRLSRSLDLEALGLEPGGELYFFIEARDNAPQSQRTRSASHVVRWPGDTQRSGDLGAGVPMLLPPEMFRSQRQIIIDAERLIAEKASIERSPFERRSNNLGLDQHALRLRYGALLGEEFEDGRPAGDPVGVGTHQDAETHHAAGDPGAARARHDQHPSSPAADHPHDEGHAAENGGLFPARDGVASGARMIDLVGELEGDLVHAHDSAEGATFFPSEIRQTLKSSLANMWESEKHLRLFAPEAALPYAYRALRLLKEVQQASRVYVRRVGFAPTPLDFTRRLTGDDVEEVQDQRHRANPVPIAKQPLVREALRSLAEWHDAEADRVRESAASAAQALDAVLPVVVSRAAAEDGVDLGAIEDLRLLAEAARGGRTTTDVLSTDRRDSARALLWGLLPMPEPAAVTRREGDEAAAWVRYRQNLGSQ